MNTNDRIITALTPGSIFNRKGHVFRSLKALADFAELETAELVDLLNGELAPMLTCKPSTQKGKGGILVALTAQAEVAALAAEDFAVEGEVPPEPLGEDEPVEEVDVLNELGVGPADQNEIVDVVAPPEAEGPVVEVEVGEEGP
jgi:hypothetical protein